MKNKYSIIIAVFFAIASALYYYFSASIDFGLTFVRLFYFPAIFLNFILFSDRGSSFIVMSLLFALNGFVIGYIIGWVIEKIVSSKATS